MKCIFGIVTCIMLIAACKRESLSNIEDSKPAPTKAALAKQNWQVVHTNGKNGSWVAINNTTAHFFEDNTCYFLNENGNQLADEFYIDGDAIFFKRVGSPPSFSNEWIEWDVTYYNSQELILSLKNSSPLILIKMKAN